MKTVNWPEMSRPDDNKIAALNETLVRLDELNENAQDLDPVVVARRVFRLTDDLVDALYLDRGEEDYEGPHTGYIYDRLYNALKADEEADEDRAQGLPGPKGVA